MGNQTVPGSTSDVNVQIKALTLDPSVSSQYKTKILPKNVVDGVNTLVQSMMPLDTGQNTKYVIRYDYTLGENITVPANCVLEFEGGSLSGDYTLTGSNTFVNVNQSTPVFDNIKMLGSFHAKEFPLNLYNTTKIDYLYTLLQSFSGTNFVLNADYSVTETDSTVDGTAPHTLNLDGNGYKLTLHSFGAYNITKCSIKNITIEAQNDSVGSWHVDDFKFGVLGYSENSTLDVYNVTFTSNVGRLYMRRFKSVNIYNCLEDGVSFYVASTHCVTMKDCRVINATGGYYQINDSFTPDDEDFTIIDNCYFENLSSFGIILTGGVKMNPTVTNCKLVNVGSGGAMNACINMHPKGVVKITDNKIVPNVDAVPLDIDGVNPNYFDENTVCYVENNIIYNKSEDLTRHPLALVGLAKLFVRNNYFKNLWYAFWDVPYLEFTENTVIDTIKDNLADNKYITNTRRALTEDFEYNVWLKYNIFTFEYNVLKRFSVSTIGTLDYNIYCKNNVNLYKIYVTTINNPSVLHTYGDISMNNNVPTDAISGDINSYINAVKPIKKGQIGLKRYDTLYNGEIRGSIVGLRDVFGNPAGTLYYGNTANRPTLCLPGTAYYDTTLGKTIYASGTKAVVKFNVTRGLVPSQNEVLKDALTYYIGAMEMSREFETTTEISINTILEHCFDSYKPLRTAGIINYTYNFGTASHTITCMYVGEIGDNYGAVHSNTVNGITEEITKVSDGSITWVDALGNPVNTTYNTGDLSNYVQKSQTAGLLKNDGTVDTTTYQSSITGTAGNLAGFNAQGKLADSGSKPSDFEPASA